LHNSMVLIRVFILLDKTHAHLVEGSYVNQRALFYELRHLQMDCSVPRTSSNYLNCSYLFPSQVQVDATIRKISHMLGSTRNELHIYPNGKGFLSGAIAFEQSDASFHIDCLREFPVRNFARDLHSNISSCSGWLEHTGYFRVFETLKFQKFRCTIHYW